MKDISDDLKKTKKNKTRALQKLCREDAVFSSRPKGFYSPVKMALGIYLQTYLGEELNNIKCSFLGGNSSLNSSR